MALPTRSNNVHQSLAIRFVTKYFSNLSAYSRKNFASSLCDLRLPDLGSVALKGHIITVRPFPTDE